MMQGRWSFHYFPKALWIFTEFSIIFPKHSEYSLNVYFSHCVILSCNTSPQKLKKSNNTNISSLSNDCKVTVEVDDNFGPNSQVFGPRFSKSPSLWSLLSLVSPMFPSIKQVMHYGPPLLSGTPRRIILAWLSDSQKTQLIARCPSSRHTFWS